MGSFFASVFATFVTVPIIGYFVVFVIAKQMTKKHRKSVHIALDTTTILFILSVHYLIVTIWEFSLLWLILILIIAMAILSLLIQYKLNEEVDYKKVFRGFWRFNFLLFFSAYIILICVGIFISVTQSIS
jgi:hypothetical protein